MNETLRNSLNNLRQEFDFTGTPIRMLIRERNSKDTD